MSESHGFIGAEQLAAVKTATHLPDLFAEYTKVRKDGANFVALCPFHQERTPSCGIFDKGSGWAFYCHGCQAKGDSVAFVELKEGLTFQESVELLARRAGITLTYTTGKRGDQAPKGPTKDRLKAVMAATCRWYQNQLSEPYGADGMTYLLGRGFTTETIADWHLGWAPGRGLLVQALKSQGFTAEEMIAANVAVDRDSRIVDRFYDRVVIPICDQFGHPVAITARMLPAAEVAARAEGHKVGKYINTAETEIYHKSQILFGFDRARKAISAHGRVVIVEGPLDVLAAHQLGEFAAVATCGTALTDAHVERLRPLVIDGGHVVMRFDDDAAGQTNTITALRGLWPVGIDVRVGRLNGIKDLGGALESHLTLAQAVASPVPADRWLVDHVIPRRPDDELERLPLIDRLLELVAMHPDATWREVVCERIAKRADFVAGKIKGRLKLRLGQVDDEAEKAPAAPGGAAAGGGDGAAVLDGGLHAAVIHLLERFLGEERIEPDAVGGWLRAGTNHPVSKTLKDLAVRFWFRYTARFVSLPVDRVSTTLAALVYDRREERRARVLEPIIGRTSNPEGMVELRRWVEAVTGRNDDTDVAVIAHFLWQVKRRSADMRVSFDLMPIVTGKQGDGKSKAVEKLCEPLLELTRAINVTDLTDDRNKAGLANYHIGIWDELAGGSKTDLQALKHTITASKVSFRELATHNINVLAKRITLIATSNDDVADIITDTTGARRFYQLTSQNPCDWDTINDIDYFLLWTAVHQDDPPPFDQAKDTIRSRQRDLVHIDSVQLWLQGESFPALDLVETDKPFDTSSKELPLIHIPAFSADHGEVVDHTYQRYTRWAKRVGQPALAANKLGARLKALGFRRLRDTDKSERNIREWRYHLPTEIPDDWAIATVMGPARVPKTPDERRASEQSAATAFGASPAAPIDPHDWEE